MTYLLDSNVLSDLVRNPDGLITRRIRKAGVERVITSSIVAAELRFGAEKKGSLALSKQVEAVLGIMPILPFDSPASAVYARIRTSLERAGTPIGGNDLLIAAHALALGFTLVTDNVREFSRVPGLRVENWLRAH